MQLRTLFANVAVSAALSITPAHAQRVDPCAVYTCMAGVSGYGATGGPACPPSVAFWHAPSPAGLAVYSPYFIPPASAALRRAYLMTCPGAQVATNAAVLTTIISMWGSLP